MEGLLLVIVLFIGLVLLVNRKRKCPNCHIGVLETNQAWSIKHERCSHCEFQRSLAGR